MLATAIWPNLTTIRQPFAKMASRAVELLTEMTNQAVGPATRQVPRELLDSS